MPKFRIVLFREVVQTEEVGRVIEAEDMDAALERAQALCSEYNMDCPDDAVVEATDARGWQVDYGPFATMETDAPADIVVEGEDV